MLWNVFRLVDVWKETSVRDRSHKLFDVDVVGVHYEDRNDIVGVGIKELSDFHQGAFIWAGIEQVTAAVAIVQCLICLDPVDFSRDCCSLAVSEYADREYILMRTPSSSCSVTPSIWLLAAFPGTTNGALCATTIVILLYLRSQNSGWPLHGIVFVGAAPELVDERGIPEVFVPLEAAPPPIWVRDTDFDDAVICEFEVVMVAFDDVALPALICEVPVT